MKNPLIGFIGQGFIGKNMADNFEERGFEIVRYSAEPNHIGNKDRIKDCDIVFIAVPTPTTSYGFDYSIIDSVLKLLGNGKIAVIKSTILPGVSRKLQSKHKNISIFHSPEFLTEANAKRDTDFPARNIIGISSLKPEINKKAKLVLSVLPKSDFELICKYEEAELVKYGGNNFLFMKVIFMNILFDYAKKVGANWDIVKQAMVYDTRIGTSHMDPMHKTSGKKGRGAGGHCFIKDMEAFIEGYANANKKDSLGIKVLESMRDKNIELLMSTGKDLDLLSGVYGEKVLNKKKKVKKKK